MASYPTLRTVSSANRDTNTTLSKTVNRANPVSTADGDLLLAFVTYGNDVSGISVAPTQSGWTQLVAPFGGTSGFTTVYGRIWHTGDVTTWGMTWTRGSTGTVFTNWSLMGVSGVDPTYIDAAVVNGTKSAGAATVVTLGTVNVASTSGVLLVGMWGGISEGGGTYSAGGDGTATYDVAQPYVRLFTKQQTAASFGVGAGSMTVQSTLAQGVATQFVMLALRPVGAQQYVFGPGSAAGAPSPVVGGAYVINSIGVLAPVRPRDLFARATTHYLQGPCMVSRCKWMTNQYQINQINTRRAHVAMGDGYDVRLIHGNALGIETVANCVPITVTGTWEVPNTAAGNAAKTSSTLLPITWGGATSVTIPVGAFVRSDPLPVQIRSGRVYYENTYVTVTAGGFIPVQQLSVDSVLFEATDNTTASDLSATTTLPTGNPIYGYSAVAIEATPFGRASVPMVVLLGDSILFGVSRTPSVSWAEQVLVLARIPHLNLAMSGEQGVQFGGAAGTANEDAGHKYRGRFIGGATDVLTDYSINDFSSAATAAQMQVRILDLARLALRVGARFHITTITPKTTSTDVWATTANQTPALSNETDRLNYNLWLRDGCPMLLASVGTPNSTGTAAATGASGGTVIRTGDPRHPIAGVFDSCAAVSAVGTASAEVWHPSAMTVDGLHPGDSGHNMIASAFVTYVAAHFAAVV